MTEHHDLNHRFPSARTPQVSPPRQHDSNETASASACFPEDNHVPSPTQTPFPGHHRDNSIEPAGTKTNGTPASSSSAAAKNSVARAARGWENDAPEVPLGMRHFPQKDSKMAAIVGGAVASVGGGDNEVRETCIYLMLLYTFTVRAASHHRSKALQFDAV